jgi:hypothetical protein
MNLAEFARWAVENGTWSGCDLDGADIQDKALECGVIVQVPYDPEKHGTQYHGELDPGEPWYVFSDEFYAAMHSPQDTIQSPEGE